MGEVVGEEAEEGAGADADHEQAPGLWLEQQREHHIYGVRQDQLAWAGERHAALQMTGAKREGPVVAMVAHFDGVVIPSAEMNKNPVIVGHIVSGV
jgi:hypothetical protein